MQKTYLLLRNNKQSGPYSLEELLQLPLQPNDLLWVEGKSTAWSYPGEIETLQAYFPAQTTSGKGITNPETSSIPREHQAFVPASRQDQKAPAKKIFISLPHQGAKAAPPEKELSPEEELEKKAEAIRLQALAAASKRKAQPLSPHPVATNAAPRTLHSNKAIGNVEVDYEARHYLKRKKEPEGNRAQNIQFALLLLAFFGGSYFVIHTYQKKKEQAPQVTVNAVENSPSVPSKTESAGPTLQQNTQPTPPAKEQEVKPAPQTAGSANRPDLTAVPAQNKKAKAESTPSVPAGITQKDPAKQDPVSTPADETAAVKPETSPTDKKKTIGSAIDNFLNKFKQKKTEAADSEAPASHLPAGSSSERNAVHREEEKTHPETSANLSSQIDLTSSQSGENWMMGVNGLRVTLHNRSSQTIQNATVEIRYYNDQNELLKKKQITFAGIPPNKSLSQAIPDERLADHAESVLLSAE